MDEHSTKSHVPLQPKIRFRVDNRGGVYTLVDQSGCQWVNGHCFGSRVSPREYPSLYFDTEVEAWAQMPKAGWEILPPETPLYRIDIYEEGARSGLGYWRYFSQTEPDMTVIPIIVEGLTELVMIPDIQRYRRYEVHRV